MPDQIAPALTPEEWEELHDTIADGTRRCRAR